MVGAIIQARTGSTRLPGKVLKEICGKPALEHFIARLRASKTIEVFIVATTVQPEDHAILKLAEQCGVRTFAGSADDVLDRFYRAAAAAKIDIIVRATSDDLLVDPDIVDQVVQHFLDARPSFDMVCNNLIPTYPYGLDVEVFSRDALKRAWSEARDPVEREHVTAYFRRHPERFRLGGVESTVNLAKHRWTLDYPEDLEFFRRIYEVLYRPGSVFRTSEIVQFLDSHPEVRELNQIHHKQ